MDTLGDPRVNSLGVLPSAVNSVALRAGTSLVSRLKSSTPSASDTLASIKDQQQALYDTLYRPAAQKLIASTNSTELVDAAKKSAGADVFAVNKARGARQKARYGVATTAAEETLGDYKAELGNTLTNVGNIDNAYVAQGERNDNVANALVGISRGISADAINGATSAAQAENNRKMTNNNIDAQNKAATTQLAGSAAAMGLMILCM